MNGERHTRKRSIQRQNGGAGIMARRKRILGSLTEKAEDEDLSEAAKQERGKRRGSDAVWRRRT